MRKDNIKREFMLVYCITIFQTEILSLEDYGFLLW